MTEDEWLSCSDSRTMRSHMLAVQRKTDLSGITSPRKQRLAGIAACWRFGSELFPEERVFLEAAEECAEKRAKIFREKLHSLHLSVEGRHEAWQAERSCPETAEEHFVADISAGRFSAIQAILDEDSLPGLIGAAGGALLVAGLREFALTPHGWQTSQDYRRRFSEIPASVSEMAAQCDLLRDIFGNPFRPVAFDPKWRTEHTTGLALKMYDDREFAAMPILADALEEAGCDNQDILTHCREPGVHVRGCWVVDLVLGKS